MRKPGIREENEVFIMRDEMWNSVRASILCYAD